MPSARVIPIRALESVAYETDPTTAQYTALEKTCTHLAQHLFEGKLPKPILVLNRGLEAASHFGARAWWARGDAGKLVSEIAINPDMLRKLTERDTAAALVHELTHLWQESFGEPSRDGYHNLQWSRKMESIGLMPFDPKDDARVGQTIRQRVIPCGRFETLFASMPREWFLPFLSAKSEEKKKDTSKSKFKCPKCGDIARGKPSLLIACRKPRCENEPFELDEGEKGDASAHEVAH